MPLLGHPMLCLEVLFRKHCMVAFGDDNRCNGRAGIETAELHRQRWCDRVACKLSMHIDRLLNARGVEVVQESAHEDWRHDMVRADSPVAFVPLSIETARRPGLRAHIHRGSSTPVGRGDANPIRGN